MPFFRAALIALLTLAGSYTLFETHAVLVGPELVIDSPQNGTTTADGFVAVTGHVARVVAFSIDGKTILPDKNGSFSETLVLPRGGSILTLRAADRFGHTVTKSRTIFAR
ncbi:MAG: hypothetical protein B7X04_00280 [Parcubacteria group bacterium 21-54-25]|nr:MAG: hypothetical protein B7X04_00280 [Parcubacteria group bacterium 21-54-25]HQU07505.1 hypothetical protein [Candidatus Paceibacterota bacterium]